MTSSRILALWMMGGLMLLSVPALAAPAEPFGQETVETRPPRHPQKAKAARAHDHKHAHGAADARGHSHAPGEAHSHGKGENGHSHGIETENLFGFTVGSDTDNAGSKSIAMEIVGRLAKRDGTYRAIGQKLEFGYGVTDNLNVAFGVFSALHRIRGVSDLDDLRFFGFNGLGTEVRWRLLKRGDYPVGVTLHFEPSWQTHDETSGKRATKYGAENKLVFDAELIKEKLFAAFNILYDVERVRERGGEEWEKGSNFGFAVAATYQVAPKTFVGGEVRYLRAYDGFTLNSLVGSAVFLGPTLFAEIAPHTWIAVAWNAQVQGKEVGNPAHLDLTNFERHQAKVKIGMEF